MGTARTANGGGLYAGTFYRPSSGGLSPERIMVCVDPARPSVEVIEAGAQLAARVGGIWYAVTVHDSHSRWSFPSQHRRSLSPNVVALIKRFGGEVIEVTAPSAAAGLIGIAFRQGFTHVFFGERRHFSLRRVFKRSACEQFAMKVPGTPVHIVPIHSAGRLPNSPFGSSASRAPIAGAAVAAGVATLAFIAVMPALLDFGIAVVIAIAWCIWLERDATHSRGTSNAAHLESPP